MRKFLTGFFLLLILIPAYFVFAQDDGSLSIEITGANPSDLPTITITSNVAGNNLPVEGLGIDNFIVGGELGDVATVVSVENITADNLPFASVLVIDTSTSMQGLPLRLAKEAATLFVQAVGEDDPIAIVTFDSDVRVVQDYTTDKDLLLEVINGLYERGRTALYDAAVVGAQVASEAPIPRRAVVLLSDGAEFGGESVNSRESGLETARERGVPVFTIGLGFGTDRSYLEELASGSNALNFESPSPDELVSIYSGLATLFRTQYVITLDSDIPLDGTEYEFTVQAVTEAGDSNIASGSIRAPIPVPIVTLDENLFTVPFSSPVTITPDIRADDDITDISVTIAGEAIETLDGSFIIDPILYPPGSYDLEITVTDSDGDSSGASASFETAPLASEVTIDFESGTVISGVTTITLSADGQTPATNASYSILANGVAEVSESSTDAENGFPFTIDPFTLPAGDYELLIGVENEGGASTNETVTFSIASLAPRNLVIDGIEANTAVDEPTEFSVSANTQAGASISETSVSINGEVLDTLEIRPASFQPGILNLEVTVTDSNGESVTETLSVEIGSLPPQISFGEVADPLTENTDIEVIIDSQTPLLDVTYHFGDNNDIVLQAHSDGTYPPIPLNIEFFNTGEISIVVEATNSGGSTATETLLVNVVLPPTATPTPDAIATNQAVIVQETADAVATVDAQSTLEAEATVDIVGTADAQATVDAEAEINAQATIDAENAANEQATADAENAANEQATVDAEAEINAQATIDAENAANEQATADAGVTAEVTAEATVEEASAQSVDETAQATEAPSGTPAFDATFTPVEIVDVTAQSADEPPVVGNMTGLLVGISIVALVFILLGILWFGRGSNNDR